jgi:hypothetical protein
VECGSMEIFSQMMRIALLLREKLAVAAADKCIGISKLYHIDILRQNDSSYRQWVREKRKKMPCISFVSFVLFLLF